VLGRLEVLEGLVVRVDGEGRVTRLEESRPVADGLDNGEKFAVSSAVSSFNVRHLA